jgi:hypothetical protein
MSFSNKGRRKLHNGITEHISKRADENRMNFVPDQHIGKPNNDECDKKVKEAIREVKAEYAEKLEIAKANRNIVIFGLSMALLGIGYLHFSGNLKKEISGGKKRGRTSNVTVTN